MTSYLYVFEADFEAVGYYESEEQVLHTYNKDLSGDHTDKNDRHGLNGTNFGEWYHAILRLCQMSWGT